MSPNKALFTRIVILNDFKIITIVTIMLMVIAIKLSVSMNVRMGT